MTQTGIASTMTTAAEQAKHEVDGPSRDRSGDGEHHAEGPDEDRTASFFSTLFMRSTTRR